MTSMKTLIQYKFCNPTVFAQFTHYSFLLFTWKWITFGVKHIACGRHGHYTCGRYCVWPIFLWTKWSWWPISFVADMVYAILSFLCWSSAGCWRRTCLLRPASPSDCCFFSSLEMYLLKLTSSLSYSSFRGFHSSSAIHCSVSLV